MNSGVDDIPLPPDELMIAVAGHAQHADFARSRINGPRQMLSDLAAAGVDVSEIADVLDFGCGCGRFLAGWAMLATPFRLYGCDYNQRLVDWCNQSIPTASVVRNQMHQPLPYGADSFDLIYLLSVFTHLTLDEQTRLAAEFLRLLRPGAHVYVTFHGDHYYAELLPLVQRGDELFERDGFIINRANDEGSNDCWTLHRPDTLLRIFTGFAPVMHFRSVERGPTDIAAWQDSLLLRKR